MQIYCHYQVLHTSSNIILSEMVSKSNICLMHCASPPLFLLTITNVHVA